MTKDKIDDMTDEELENVLKNDNENLQADQSRKDEIDEALSNDAVVYTDKEDEINVDEQKTLSAESVNQSIVKEEIEVKSVKEQKKLDKQKAIEEKKMAKAKTKMIKKHRKEMLKNPEKLIRYDTDVNLGLSQEIVDKRYLDNLVNDTNNKTSKSIAGIIFSNIFTFFNILCFAIAGVLISVKAVTDLVFLVIVSANIIIGIVQEIRAKKIIDRLSLISAPSAIVRRDGVNHEVAVNEVVLDDLLLLENGKQICADSIVLDGQVEVNESLLTGESDAIVKKPGDILYSGSFVVSGKCSARVDKIGKDNYIEQLTSQAKKYKKPKSDLLFSLTWIIRVMAIIIIPIGIMLFYLMYFKNGLPYVYSIRKTAGAMIGMIPSGLFLMTSIALAVGVIRLAQRNVLVQELYCIEMLARVNCICLDKTGTITDGTMSVKNVIDYNTVYGLATKNIVSAMLNALPDNNLTSVALQEKFGLGKRMKHIAAIPFSSQRKYQAVTFDKFGTFILGAPEFVLKDKFNLIKNDVNKYAALGYRVLCLAHKEGVIKDGVLPNSLVEVVSMILIEDNIRPDAVNTIRYFKESGVKVRVISGDNPLTVSKISQRAGIDGAENYISLDGMSDNDVKKAAMKYTVFGRVSPGQKKLLIETLKENGLTVAMTGDGVNDILALKEADCSIAVASGSEAARNVSHLVLLDSNFDSMPKVVAEGRRVINNVTSVASLFLTKTIFSLFLAFQALSTGVYPISTNQLILIDTLAIGLPSLVLVMEPNNNEVQGKFLNNVIKKALPGAIVILFISILVFSLSNSLGFDQTTISTIIVIAATHTCLMVLFKACKPLNTLRKGLCTLCYTLFIFFIVFMPQFLEFRPILKFSEYYSNNLTTKVIASYPKVEISKDSYYILDGVVTSIAKGPNDKADKLTSVKTSDGYYYAINGNITNYMVNIPDVTYSDNAKIYFGGYVIKDAQYSDLISYSTNVDGETIRESHVNVNSNGLVFYGEKPLIITLSKDKNSEYYNHNRDYGNAKDQDVQYKILPTVEFKDGELLIDGLSSTTILVDDEQITVKYKLPSNIATTDTIKATIDPKTMQLLVNDKPVELIDERGLSLENKQYYTLSLPQITENNGRAYIDAVDSGLTIYELYGNTNDGGKTYTVNYDGNDIKLVKNSTNKYIEYKDKTYSVNDMTNSLIFEHLESQFETFKIIDDGALRLINLNIEVRPYNQTSSSNVSNYYIYANNSYTQSVTIGESSLCPDITTTVSGRYVINGYYTDFISTGDNLNPVLDENNYLVLGGVTTNCKVASTDIIIQNGGIVKQLSTPGIVFLVMLCALAGPLMKLLTNIIPWIIKQGKLVQKLLSKF